MLQPQICILKEGTENTQGRDQIISNINACIGVVEVVRTTLVRKTKTTKNYNFYFYSNRVQEDQTNL